MPKMKDEEMSIFLEEAITRLSNKGLVHRFGGKSEIKPEMVSNIRNAVRLASLGIKCRIRLMNDVGSDTRTSMTRDGLIRPTKPLMKLNRNAAPSVERKSPKPDTYKTVMCQAWLENSTCAFGENCRFAHGERELRPSKVETKNPKYKTKLCDKYASGICPYGDRCLFIHPDIPNGTEYLHPSLLAARKLTKGKTDNEDDSCSQIDSKRVAEKQRDLQLVMQPAIVWPSGNPEVSHFSERSNVKGERWNDSELVNKITSTPDSYATCSRYDRSAESSVDSNCISPILDSSKHSLNDIDMDLFISDPFEYILCMDNYNRLKAASFEVE